MVATPNCLNPIYSTSLMHFGDTFDVNLKWHAVYNHDNHVPEDNRQCPPCSFK